MLTLRLHLIALLGFAVVAAATPPAMAAAKPDLAVRSVTTARSAAAGGPLDIAASIRRAGRTPAVGLGLYLSQDRVRDRRDVRLTGDGRVSPGGPARALRVTARPNVPAGQAPGAYRLIACVDDLGRVRERSERNNCRAAKGAVQVTPRPVGTRDLVAAAVAARRLTPQQGLVYRVFAAFGDRRLPAAYAGDRSVPDDLVMRDVVEAWPTLSAAQRAAINPFLMPPAAKGSWASRGASAASIKPALLVQRPGCVARQIPSDQWRTIAKPGGHVRIWWLRDEEKRVGAHARSLLAEVENVMWPRLLAVMDREPLSDGGEPCFHGVDGKLDIYMGRLPKGLGLTLAYRQCTATPAFIVFDVAGSLRDRSDVAHELMHAFQFAFHARGACSGYDNWDEATAEWAMSYVYPNDNSELYWPWGIQDPDKSLTEYSYEGWVFPYAMGQLHGNGVVGSIYKQIERQPDVLRAIDAGVPGGLKQAYPEFAKAAWNQDPVTPNFAEWDGLKQRPEDHRKRIEIERLDPGTKGQEEVDVPLDLKPLSRAYRHVKFGPGIRQVTIFHPYDPDLHVEALLRLRDGTLKTDDLGTGKMGMYCPQSAGQQIDDAVLVVSNTSLTRTVTPSQQLKVVGSNIGCDRYTGWVRGVERTHTQSINTTETWDAGNVTFQRAGDTVEGPTFKLVGGTVAWKFDGTNQGCALHAAATIPIKPDGSQGFLDIGLWNYGNAIRRSLVAAYNLPVVQGTGRCSDGVTRPWNFTPHTLWSAYPSASFDVAPDGSVSGAQAHDEQSGGARDLSTTWRLEPSP